ncbi:unnamed protein product [Effrenium voratum]|uniref:Uncharacterized protein n=1 Tax=Effrenium voratum TaxID=2562239 RepID=A0AA36I202_9DINO|nr:unnamed protein product [Effrenium voratum]
MRGLAVLLAWQVHAEVLSASPLGQALDLLNSLKSTVEADAVKQQEAYQKYKAWCETETAELLREVETQKKEADKVAAEIYEAEASLNSATASAEKLASQVARSESKMQSAQSLRDEEKKDFKASEVSLLDTIGTLDKAGEAISGQALQKGLALQQLPSEEVNRVSDMLVGLAAVVDSGRALALLQGLGDGSDAAPDAQTQELTDLLKQMQDEAERSLAELRQKEDKAVKSYELLTASLRRQLAEDNQSLESAKASQGAATTAKAKLQGDRTGAASGSDTVQNTLKVTQDACMQAAADEEASEQGRRREVQVLAEAARVLKDTAEGSLSFLQFSSSSRSGAGQRQLAHSAFTSLDSLDEDANSQEEAAEADSGRVVLGLLKRLAKQSPVLAQLAGRVSSAFRAGGHPLDSVRKMVQGLILKMQEQMTADAQEEAYCKTEKSRSEARLQSLQNTVQTSQSEIDLASSSAAVLRAEIENQQEELGTLAKEQAEMTSSLEKMKQDFELSKSDLQKGLQGIRAAMDQLQTYYGSQPSLLQSSKGAARTALNQVDANPPRSKEVALMAASVGMDASEAESVSVEHEATEESLSSRTFAAVAALEAAPVPPPQQHVASIGAGTNIIQVLQICESRFADNLAQLETQAGDQQMQQAELMKQNEILQKQKEMEVGRKTKEAKSAESEANARCSAEGALHCQGSFTSLQRASP